MIINFSAQKKHSHLMASVSALVIIFLLSPFTQSTTPFIDCSQHDRINLTIFAISNNNAASGKAIVGGQWLAIQEINNDPNILPDYCLNLEGLRHSHTYYVQTVKSQYHRNILKYILIKCIQCMTHKDQLNRQLLKH